VQLPAAVQIDIDRNLLIKLIVSQIILSLNIYNDKSCDLICPPLVLPYCRNGARNETSRKSGVVAELIKSGAVSGHFRKRWRERTQRSAEQKVGERERSQVTEIGSSFFAAHAPLTCSVERLGRRLTRTAVWSILQFPWESFIFDNC